MNSKGDIKHDTESMKAIAIEYYTDLFDTKVIDNSIAQRLLRNIKNKITPQQRASLDKIITKEELDEIVSKLPKNKTPEPDGIPAEFYQTYWIMIEHLYLDFINAVKETGLPKDKNTSITTLVYKKRGDTCLLAN